MRYLGLFTLLVFLWSNSAFSGNNSGDHVEKPKNIILLIGDGMGVTQVYAGYMANKGKLNLFDAETCGFILTSSESDLITDSGAAGTALATGYKTYNGAIGMNADKDSVPNLVEIASGYNKATGVISTSSVTHATPASFVAHEESRSDDEAIAMDFTESPVDVFIGGGKSYFVDREDNENLIEKLQNRGYSVYDQIEDVREDHDSDKVVVFTAEKHNPKYNEGRKNMLPDALNASLNVLSKDNDGFFLMAEASQIDWGGHANDVDYITSEMLDFDCAVKVAFEFARENKETLVIVTADHETGGMTITGGNIKRGKVNAEFSTGKHTPVMVPVFAFGKGAERFSGIYENTGLFEKIKELLE